jgi:hypothetical protein
VSLACVSSTGDRSGLSRDDYSCSSAYRSVTEAREDIKVKTPKVYGLRVSFYLWAMR